MAGYRRDGDGHQGIVGEVAIDHGVVDREEGFNKSSMMAANPKSGPPARQTLAARVAVTILPDVLAATACRG